MASKVQRVKLLCVCVSQGMGSQVSRAVEAIAVVAFALLGEFIVSWITHSQVRTLLQEDRLDRGLSHFDFGPVGSSTGPKDLYLTYTSREEAVNAWNILRFWWFHAPLPGLFCAGHVCDPAGVEGKMCIDVVCICIAFDDIIDNRITHGFIYMHSHASTAVIRCTGS